MRRGRAPARRALAARGGPQRSLGRTAMLGIALILQEGDITLGRVLSDIPHNASALVVYVLLAAFVYLIWRGSRSAQKQKEGP
jgi:hypothetical protein